MNNNSGNHFFPFPVLGNKNAIGGFFDFVKPVIREKSSEISITGTLRCTNKTLIKLCCEGDAEAFGHIECLRTSYRSAFKSKRWSDEGETDFNCSINSSLLRGNAEVGFFIIATKGIENYCPQSLDPLFGKAKFNLAPKAILAVSKRFYLNIQDELIQSSNSSIFIFDKGTQANMVYWEFDRPDGKIGIMVPPSDLNTIRNLRNNELFLRTTIVSFILPALAQALKLLFSPDAYAWKTPLKAIIDREGIEINSAVDYDQTYKIAQNLLKKKEIQENIFTTMLQEILNPTE